MRMGLGLYWTLAWMSIAAGAADNGWSTYGGDAAGTRYSGLKQVTRENVRKLRPV